jgi:uncharacterized membrane protein YbhN (UPF0104 family)
MRRSSPEKNRYSILRFIGSALALLLLVYLLSRQGWREIWFSIQQISWGRSLLAFGLIMVSRFAVAGRWYTLLHNTPAQLPAKQVLRITFAGLFASNFLPTTVGGDIVRLAGAARFKVDRAVVAASLVVDRLVGLVGMATTLPFGARNLLAWLERAVQSQGISIQHAAIVAVPLGRWGKAIWGLADKTIHKAVNALSVWTDQPRSLLNALLFTWLHMASKFLAIQILFLGMQEGATFWLIGGLWSFTYFITLFPVSINGLGIQEVSMAFIFANIGGFSMNSALTAALLVRTLEMVASLPGALFLPEILSGIKDNQDSSEIS